MQHAESVFGNCMCSKLEHISSLILSTECKCSSIYFLGYIVISRMTAGGESVGTVKKSDVLLKPQSCRSNNCYDIYPLE